MNKFIENKNDKLIKYKSIFNIFVLTLFMFLNI